MAVDDVRSTPVNTAVTIAVLANDSDPDGDAYTVTAFGAAPNGTVACDAGSCRYTPQAGFTGTDAFTYTITDATGRTASAIVRVTVTAAPDLPPTFDADSTNTAQTVAVGDPVTRLTATDPENATLTYALVNGSLPPGVTLNRDGTFAGAPTVAGRYPVTISVSDPGGQSATTTLTITVPAAADDQPPVFTSAPSNTAQTVQVGAPVAPVLANDPDDTVLAYVLTSGTLPPGVTALNSDGTFAGTPSTPGSYVLGITVRDPAGASDTTSLTVTVPAPANRAPVARDDDRTTPLDTPITIDVLANDADADDDPLTVASFSGSAGGTVSCSGTTLVFTPDNGFTGVATFTYVVSDGVATASATVTVTVVAPTAGNQPPAFPAPAETRTVTVGSPVGSVSASDPDDTVLTYVVTGGALPPGVTGLTPEGTFVGAPTTPGTYTVEITVTDPSGASDVLALSILVPTPPPAPVNRTPVAVDDSRTTLYQTAVTVAVLTNDTDPDGDSLTVVSATQPSNGSVSCTTTACTYTPRAGFSGVDSFTYTVSDGNGGTATATVRVTVGPIPMVNAAPVFGPAPTNTAQTVAVGSKPVALQATDADDTSLVFVVTGGTLPPGISLGTDGVFTGTATTPGTYTVTVTVSDPAGAKDTVTLVLTVPTAPAANRAPVAVDDTRTTPAGTPLQIAVLGNDSDPDGDPLTVTASTQPANGSVSCTATACTYTPRAGFTGSDAFTYTVSDGKGGTATATVTVTVTDAGANQPPVFSPVATNTAQVVPVGSTPSPLVATDPEAGIVTYVVTGGALPPGVTLNPDGTFSGTATVPGTYSVEVTATDPLGASTIETLVITVAGAAAAPNTPPVARPDSPSTVAGQPVVVNVLSNDTDAEGDPLTIVSVTQPSNGTVVCTTSVCTYTPEVGFSGTDTFTYTVSDGTDTSVGVVTVAVAPGSGPVTGPVTVPGLGPVTTPVVGGSGGYFGGGEPVYVGGGLARTGAPVIGLTQLALLMLGLGAVLAAGGRRRRRTTASGVRFVS